MGVVVIYIDQVPNLAAGTLEQLTATDPGAWSAATVCWKNKYLIVMNSAHAPARQSSSLMHELAHLIIGHKPARLDITPDGLMILSSYDKQNEEEANWLAAALLLPREALLHIRRHGMTNEQAAAAFGCSVQMFTFRINTTGVDVQLRRTKEYR
jgi:Zn-dependent peptidase ImmA (M78 family)